MNRNNSDQYVPAHRSDKIRQLQEHPQRYFEDARRFQFGFVGSHGVQNGREQERAGNK